MSVTEERGARGDKRMMPSSTYLYIKGEREKGMLLAVFLALASSVRGHGVPGWEMVR